MADPKPLELDLPLPAGYSAHRRRRPEPLPGVEGSLVHIEALHQQGAADPRIQRWARWALAECDGCTDPAKLIPALYRLLGALMGQARVEPHRESVRYLPELGVALDADEQAACIGAVLQVLGVPFDLAVITGPDGQATSVRVVPRG